MGVYDHQQIEKRWRNYWDREGVYRTEDRPDAEHYYCLEMFPYPSGRLHMGHIRNYSIGDVVARFKRMNGVNVLHPMGWDAFGLPAENAAIAQGVPPAEWTEDNIAHMREQLRQMGFGYDWGREISTCDPQYYRWTQWIFLQLYKKDLAYKEEAPLNWCPQCQTVLANEQVVQGACERCETAVTSRRLNQWFFRITAYADRLLDNLDKLDGWPDRVKAMQAHWIGRSEGVEIQFPIKGTEHRLTVFTTRPDTLFGATYMVMAPELPLVSELIADQPNRQEIEDFIARAAARDEHERTLEDREKEGIFTGSYCINPLSGEEIPIYLGDYVLAGYGTGSIMAVPAHDQRDLEFARRYDIPVRVVIQGETAMDAETLTEAYVDSGTLVHSGDYSGLSSAEAWERIADDLAAQNFGERTVNYRLRDWLISRQRYWGVPIPIVECASCGTVPVPEDELPILLPDNVAFEPTGRSPLVALDDFVNTTCPKCGGAARRETDTMDTFVDSSWYFLRYGDPRNDQRVFDKDIVDRWMPVDQYIGGIEHAILHLLYARFITMVLHDLDLVHTDEPFRNLLTQGMVLKDGAKMSKSRGNTVDPEDIIVRFGADTTRIFVLFAAPPERDLEWGEQGVEGSFRFLNRLYRIVMELARPGGEDVDLTTNGPGADDAAARTLRRAVHTTIQRVTDDIAERFHFNTAISAMMELVNAMYAHKELPDGERDDTALLEAAHHLVLLLAPFAPFLADELWHALGHDASVHLQSWPKADPEMMAVEERTIVVQVNGRVRDRMNVPVDLDDETLKAQAMALPKVQEMAADGEIKNIVLVPGRLVNVVVEKS